MTTEVVSRITTIARRFEPMWRQAGGRNPTSAPAAESEHELVSCPATVRLRGSSRTHVATAVTYRSGSLVPAGRPTRLSSRSVGRSDRRHDTGSGHLAGPRVGDRMSFLMQ